MLGLFGGRHRATQEREGRQLHVARLNRHQLVLLKSEEEHITDQNTKHAPGVDVLQVEEVVQNVLTLHSLAIGAARHIEVANGGEDLPDETIKGPLGTQSLDYNSHKVISDLLSWGICRRPTG